MTALRSALLCIAVAVLVAGCGDSTAPAVAVEDPAASATAGGISAAYATLTNRGDEDDALVGMRCTCAERVSIHHMERHDGTSKMVSSERLDVPARAQVALTPGGSHLMLEGLTEPIVAGDVVELTFEFERSGELTFEVPVVAPAELVDRVDPPADEGA